MNFTNLFIGYNEEEDFRVLICALDIEEANEIARQYAHDSYLEGWFEISEPVNGIDNLRFDCDYVLTYCDDSL